MSSDKELVFKKWDSGLPSTFRKAKALVGEYETVVTEGTLRAYFSQWKRSHGIQRRYKRSEKKDE